MKIAFIYPAFENLGIEYLSAVLKKAGHQTELIFDPGLFDDDIRYDPLFRKIFNFRKYIIKSVIKSQPDLIAFSVVSDRYPWACEIAKEIKEKTKAPIVFGGIHPTSMPGETICNDFVDYVVLGEGEEAMVELAERLENKEDASDIKNVWLKRNGNIVRNELRKLVHDLDLIPFPDKELYSGTYTDFKGQYTIITSRGCAFSCTYCCNNFLKNIYHDNGRYRRCRSIENVIAELKLAKEKYKMSSVIFFDEELFFESERASKLLQLYKKEINLPFWCYFDPRIMDEAKIDILESGGCSEIEMGIQDLDPVINKKILKRNINLKHLKKIIRKLQKTKILVAVDIMLGLPLQEEKNIISMVDFFNENRVFFPFVFWTRYYPKTEITDIAVREGAIETSKLDSSRAFFVRGSTFNPQFAKIANLFYLCCLLPKWSIRLIVNKKIYKYFPPAVFKFFLQFCIGIKLVFLTALGFRRGKERVFFVNRPLYYLYYFWKWLTIR